MAEPLRILFTNNTLMKWAGTERAVYDAAVRFHDAGHGVCVFSPQLGEVAEALRAREVEVIADPAQTDFEPWIIHGQHQWETSVAALRWPRAALLSFCRGQEAWQEAPCPAPWVYRFVAIDENCRQRLVEREGVDPRRVVLLLNGVDLEVFHPRSEPLPEKARSLLVFSNYAREGPYLQALRKGAARAGLRIDVVGAGVGNATRQPREVLARYDIVLAKGRAALEALAVGAAVVVCDVQGLGPLVTTRNFEQLRLENFGFSCMGAEPTPGNLMERLRQYDPADAARVTEEVRRTCGVEHNHRQLEELYRRSLAHRGERSPDEISALATGILSPYLLSAKLGRELRLEYRRRQDRPAGPASSAREQALEYDRILHAFRRGWSAREHLKRLRKTTGDQETEPKSGGFFRWFKKS